MENDAKLMFVLQQKKRSLKPNVCYTQTKLQKARGKKKKKSFYKWIKHEKEFRHMIFNLKIYVTFFHLNNYFFALYPIMKIEMHSFSTQIKQID